MSAATNGKSELATQVPDKEKSAHSKKRAKAEEKAASVKKRDDSDEENEEEQEFHDDGDGADFFNAVTKFSALKPGCYYKIVRLANYRNHRLVAVPVKGFAGTFKNFNNLVQQ